MRPSLDAARQAALNMGVPSGMVNMRGTAADLAQLLRNPAPHATPAGAIASEGDDDRLLTTRAGPASYGVLEERPVEDFQEGYDEEMLDEDSEGDYEDEGREPQVEGAEGDDVEGGDEDHVGYIDPTSVGLKEINNLAHFGVSSHKPGNGVEELLSDDLDKYWQSDGQQPHFLTIHFLRRVEIRAIRFFVDHKQDESYTPTHITFHAGTGHHDLIQFADMPLIRPVGWQDVPLIHCGGGPDGHSLCCWIVQMQVKENHQNGKDTHIRGIKIYALDDSAAATTGSNTLHEIEHNIDEAANRLGDQHLTEEDDEELRELLAAIHRTEDAAQHHSQGPGERAFSTIPDSMREPELR